MLVGGVFDLNSMQIFADPLKEDLKETMLNQEVTFRNQVHELHRLYKMQRIMMDDFHGYNFHKTNTQSFLWPPVDPIRNGLRGEERSFSKELKVGSAGSTNNYYLEEQRVNDSRFQQSPLDLQLLPNHSVNHVGEKLLERENGWNSPKESLVLNQYFHVDNVTPSGDVKLYLSTGGNTWTKTTDTRHLYDKITKLSSPYVIGLEDPTENLLKEDCEPLSALHYGAQANYSRDKHGSQVSNQPNRSFKNDLSQGLMMSQSVVDKGKSFGLFDLNIAQPEDSSFNSNDAVVINPSMASSSYVFDGQNGKFHKDICPNSTGLRKPESNFPSATSTLLGQDCAVNPTMIDSSNEKTGANFWATSARLEARSESKGCHSEIRDNLGRQTRNSENGNVHLADLEGKRVEEDMGFLHPCASENTFQDGHGSKAPSPGQIDCVVDDNSNSAKTMQSGTYLEDSNVSPTKFPKSQSSQVAETSSDEHNLRSSDSIESKHECFNKKEEESEEVDVLIRIAAESLIHISSEDPTRNRDCFTKMGSDEIENKKKEHPQISSDSFESIVLKLRESSLDDYCVSSTPLEINKMENKDSGIKLKRGRRFKDFQKDILPSLASLSRHEIREDINIIEGVLRSREYKRMRSKTGDGANWSSPVRSKRSRINYVGRRYYS